MSLENENVVYWRDSQGTSDFQSERTAWFAFHQIPVTLEIELTPFPLAAFVSGHQ